MMSPDSGIPTRRDFLQRLGVGAAAGILPLAPIGELAAQSNPEWDTRWIDRVKRAKHRVVFDAPSGSFSLDLATRYLNHLDLVHHPRAGEVAVVLNFRTRAIFLGLGDEMWQKYPLGEDYKINDPATGAPARRNLDLQRTPDPMVEGEGVAQLQRRGAIVLVCDFALGHLARRIATAVSADAAATHAAMRSGLVPGAILVPSGIYGMAEAQNAGCAFVPA